MYRQIYLVNSQNQKFGDTENIFFSALSGFGCQTSITGTRVGNSLLVSNSLQELVVKNTELLFWGSNEETYQNYLKFARFIQYEPLYLYYKTPNRNDAVFSQVKIVQVDKGQKGEDGILRVPLQIQPLTFWYDEAENVISTSRVEKVGKTYELKRPYAYSIISTSNISLFNNGMNDAPMIIEIDGLVTDIQYNLIDEFGLVYGVGKIKGTYDHIVINSYELDETITLSKNGVIIPNPYNYQDLNIAQLNPIAQTTFLKLKTGRSVMKFLVDESFKGTITIRWRNTYATI